MKILFLTRLCFPHIGGVEKHVHEVTKNLVRKGNDVKIISEADIKYPHKKLIGLLYIWLWFWKNRKLIEDTEIIHIHDVFIWYLPFRFLYLNKKVVTTIHGLEWDNPLSNASLWQKRLAVKLSNKTVGVGKFLKKYLKVKFDLITYGAASINKSAKIKSTNSVVYVGRLEENTGLLEFLKWLDKHKFKVDFCGDGPLRQKCEQYGNVHGFTDPTSFLSKAKYCVPGGYLAALEALKAGCELKLFWNGKVKKDYWQRSPFVKKNIKNWAKSQSWEKLSNEYLRLYNSIK